MRIPSSDEWVIADLESDLGTVILAPMSKTTRQIHLAMLSVSHHATFGLPKTQPPPFFITMMALILLTVEVDTQPGFLYRHLTKHRSLLRRPEGNQKLQAWIAPGSSTCAEQVHI
jgi:hypothetical protein